ncbi:unannotated protein [freshwater metagenome]|uniref:Unannotated protein n=1 Tax=freshwater metagenome TaxID=449393 RepID=A0A6J6BAW9_9ZZZZ
MRSARSRTWDADSSPLMYSAEIPFDADCAATESSNVDLPTPGSPANKIAAPGTKPPPRTRSSSETPVGRAWAADRSTSPIGVALAVTFPATSDNFLGAAISSTTPHAWHSPQRPTHFWDVQPHSVQRNGSFSTLAMR